MNRLFLLIICLLSFDLSAQVEFVERLEIDLNETDFAGGTLVTFGEEGFLVHSLVKDGKEIEHTYDLYNKDLKKVKSANLNMSKKYGFDEACSTKTRLHKLYNYGKGKYALVNITVPELSIKKVDVLLPSKIIITEMRVLEDLIYVTAYQKSALFLFAINWKTGDRKIIPINVRGYKPKSVSLENFQMLEEAEELMLFLKARNGKEKEVFVMTLDKNGAQKELFNLTATSDKNASSVSAAKIGENTYIFTGTYAQKLSEMSQGMYIAKVKNGKLVYMKFHNFLDMEGFLDYLPERKQAKIEKKKSKKEEKGKELVFNYRTVNHNIISINDQYLLIAEAYYATYRYYSTTSTNAQGQTVVTQHKKFDGYEYTHAAVTAFDESGNIAWSNIFPMELGYKPMYAIKFIRVKEVSDLSVDLVFASRGYIQSKSFSPEGRVLEDVKSEIIETGNDGDKLRRSSNELTYWYGVFFIAHGYQKIKNREDADVKKVRKVYYISKIKY